MSAIDLFDYHTRICRPVGLSSEDRQAVCDYAIERVGLQYDLKNIVDLGRYLVPLPVPQRFRRRMIALGSGDPTKLMLRAIAKAFAAIGYPILPAIEHVESASARREIYRIRDSSPYCPRDFDISPYFAIISQRSKWASTISRSTGSAKVRLLGRYDFVDVLVLRERVAAMCEGAASRNREKPPAQSPAKMQSDHHAGEW